MGNLSPIEIVVCVLISIAFLSLSFFSNRFLQQKLAEQGKAPSFALSLGGAFFFTGIFLLGATTYIWLTTPSEGAFLLVPGIIIASALIAVGLYLKRRKVKNR